MSPAGNLKSFPLDDSGTALIMSVWLNTPLITNSAGKLSFCIVIIPELLQLQNHYLFKTLFHFCGNFIDQLVN